MRKRFAFGFILLIGTCLLATELIRTNSATAQQASADLILINGVFYTVNEKQPQAEAVAVRGDRILFVGDHQGAQRYQGVQTRIIDLKGKAVVPGLIDAHAHFIGLGESLARLNFVGTTSYEQIVSLVIEKAAAAKPGEWIFGRGWDQNDWPKKAFPTHEALSAISPNNPVYLTRVDGHAALVNKKAMELANLTKDTKDPDGGKIIRDAVGNPTGVLIDRAQSLVSRVIPPATQEQIREAALRAMHECLRHGLTGVHDAGVSGEVIQVYKRLIDEGKFDFRIYAMIGGTGKTLEDFLKTGPLIGYGNNRLTVRSVKLVADGALGSRGAAMLEPYSDDPSNKGLLMFKPDEFYAAYKKATAGGFQVNTHAIGDAANRLLLDTVERLEKENPKVRGLRLRDEHAQIVAVSDLPRFVKFGVIPSMQATHCTSDMDWAGNRVGPERIKGAYAWRSLLKTGVRIANGSDFPVEGVNPLWGIYAAITRQDHKGWPKGGWRAEEKMTRDEALRSFTLDAAYAAFEENIKGSIEVGKLADFVVLSKDIMKIEPREILSTETTMTILGGKIVYQK